MLKNFFTHNKPIIACIHLQALPGAPAYDGNIKRVYEHALAELEIYKLHKVDGIIIENFRDKPFYPDKVPAETIAAMAGISREIVKQAQLPIGINVLRNDANAAMAIATAVNAQFIRVTAHMGVLLSEQGLLQGHAYNTLRLRKALQSSVCIFADVDVKHTVPLVHRGIEVDTKDLCERGLADAVIVSGKATGTEVNLKDLEIVKKNSSVPVFIGSGVTQENLHNLYHKADGFIIGSYFKKDGKAENAVDATRTHAMMQEREKLLSCA